jgi:integrase
MRDTFLQIARRLGYASIEAAPWHTLTRASINDLLGAMQAEMKKDSRDPRYSPATLNRYLAGLKGMAKEARYLGLMTAEQSDGIRDIKGVKGSRVARGRALELSEAERFLAACDKDERLQSVRDKAMFALMFGSGMRRTELISLNLEQLDWQEMSFRSVGKGNKERDIDMTPRAWRLLKLWLDVRGTDKGPVFVRISRNNNMTNDRLTDQAVYYLTKKRQLEAGLKSMSPHDMRRSFITWMLDSGEDISVVADMVGHTDIRTTKKYDKRERRARQAKYRAKEF